MLRSKTAATTRASALTIRTELICTSKRGPLQQDNKIIRSQQTAGDRCQEIHWLYKLILSHVPWKNGLKQKESNRITAPSFFVYTGENKLKIWESRYILITISLKKFNILFAECHSKFLRSLLSRRFCLINAVDLTVAFVQRQLCIISRTNFRMQKKFNAFDLLIIAMHVFDHLI